jgi:hypothetical protein
MSNEPLLVDDIVILEVIEVVSYLLRLVRTINVENQQPSLNHILVRDDGTESDLRRSICKLSAMLGLV